MNNVDPDFNLPAENPAERDTWEAINALRNLTARGYYPHDAWHLNAMASKLETLLNGEES